MSEISTVCVFCGSSGGAELAFGAAARGLGTGLADAVVEAGGRATGVITEALAGHEIVHASLHDFHVVHTMHERKALMSELVDAFVMLPGGLGTCEEFMESVTWARLGIQHKRCGILNVHGFFDHLLTFVGHAVEQGFIEAPRVECLVVAETVPALLDGFTHRAGPASLSKVDTRESCVPIRRQGPADHSIAEGPTSRTRPAGRVLRC